MPDIETRIRVLFPRDRPVSELDSLRRMLGPVLRHGAHEELEALGRALLGRPHPEAVCLGLEALDRAFPGEAARPDDDLDQLIRRTATLNGPTCDAAALQAAFVMLPEALHGDLLILCGLEASGAGIRLIERHLAGSSDWQACSGRLLLSCALLAEPGTTADRAPVEQAIVDALAAWEWHESRSVLLAAMVLAGRSGGPLADELARADHPGVLALRRLVREARDEPVRSRLVRLAGVRGLSEAAVTGLETVRIGRVDSVFAHGAHLARVPRRRRRLSRSRVPTRLSGRLAQRMPVDAVAARTIPTILAGSDLVRSQVDDRLVTLAGHPDRLASVLATISLLDRAPDEDRRMAVESILASTVDPLITRVIESGTRRGNDIEAMRGLPDFEEALQTRPGWWCAACALEHLRERPDALEHVLRRALHDGTERACRCALEVISRRRMVPRFESDLVSIVEAGPGVRPPLLVARVLRLLASGPTGRSSRAIVRSLASPHPELQAEALAAATDPKASPAVRSGCSLVDVALLERLTCSSEARVRTGALRALRLRSGSRARTVVRRLLDDESPELRLTGLDAVRSTCDPEYRGPVLRLMERELLPEIMTRGRTVLRFLDSRTRVTSPDPVGGAG